MAQSGRGVLDGAFALLEELTRVGEVGLTQLATGTGLPKATAYRLLSQLIALGAVERREGRYRSVNVGVPDAGRTLIVATLRGEADDAIEVRPGLRFPHGVGQDRLWAAYLPEQRCRRGTRRRNGNGLVRNVHEQDGLVINKECPYVPAVSTVGACSRRSPPWSAARRT